MSDPLERFKGILAAIATTRPGLPIEDALTVAREVEQQMIVADWAKDLEQVGRAPVPNDDTPVDVAGAWCREQPIVVDFVAAGKLINAIKEARGLSGMGLYAAKRAVEYMRDHLLP